ncbi:hypothetical protein SISSUDRAFT_1066653 [Sistotremastrum suecicum HHB10207 ss-3]|uniref:Heparinase II/III-like C-terminal domain-containing protein n=1 Tax=Sistotremastrum suecicum HHB10207 ss-3 TaxID=1314776 RepID=A0A165Y241_9AGAM|nr:hypothetical protein SISSUDRAFT_1066653 [Sistotremastrum suecicum HHB10207 ss-3]
MARSFDSGQRPLTNVPYESANNPYNSGAGFYNESSGFLPPQQRKKSGLSPWIKFGIPIVVIIIAAAVVGGVVGSRDHKSSTSSSGSSSSGPSNPSAAASSAVNNKEAIGVFPTATDSYGLPVYPTTANTAAFVAPTFVASATSAAWPSDTFTPSSPAPTSVRSDRPRLIAPKYKWDALPGLIANDPYLQEWNATIIGNATAYNQSSLVQYTVDGGLSLSGVLDVARQVKERLKAYAYAFRITGNKGWVDRAWDEILNASNNGSQPFSAGNDGDNWNSQHFLDVGEFTAGFAIAYDWLYDQWSDDQRNAIMWTMLNLGLNKGVQSYTNNTFHDFYGWWQDDVNGNWNCVCNSGLTLGALALLGDDPTGQAQQLLGFTIPNALANCVQGPSTDGTWSETANYWYFGTTGHSEMTSALMTATGSDYGMLHNNTAFNQTGLFHMYVTGMTSLFNYGDHGPNKYSTTADSLLFYGTQYNTPAYMLFQRDQRDAHSDPWAMFWYDPTVTGAFWDNLPLDHFFDDPVDQWASMRTSWTSNEGLYAAIKSGQLQKHQNHNDLDCGDFVLDAMGQRWAGELGSGDYDASGYFNGNAQDGTNGQRWLYYRKRTEGQNTIVVGEQNQLITAEPTIKHGSTGEVQDATTTYQVPSTSLAYFTTDMSSAYSTATSMKRGLRLLAGRKQVLLQDEMDTSAPIQWRMHTNATVTLNGATATLALGGQTMIVQILSPSSATFTTLNATRYADDPPLPPNQVDQPNPGVTVLAINLDAGQQTVQVLFNPQWPGSSSSDFVTPPSVSLDDWSLTSHNQS